MFSFYFLFLALVSTSTHDEGDLRKALEFQYQQKLSKLLQENENLKAEVNRLKAQASVPSEILGPLTVLKDSSDSTNSKKIIALTNARNQTEEQKIYREGLIQIQDEKWDEALLTMESFVKRNPRSELADHAIYWMAQIYIQKNEIGLARAELERLIHDYPKGERAKRALARLMSLPGGSDTAENSENRKYPEQRSKKN